MATADVVHISKRLIGLDSQTRVSNAAIADFISELISPVAAQIERIEYADAGGQSKVSLVAQLGEGEGGLALSAHMDTVPGLGWPTDPLEARTEGGRLYGLGACDMKGPLACTLIAALTYPTLDARRPLTLLYSSDEETDTEGARRIARDSRILASVRPEYCIVAEPTDLQVVNAHKAAVTFSATAKGRAAHSSTGEGINANNKMIPFLYDLWRLQQELTEQEAYRDPDFEPPFPDWNIVIDNFDAAPNVTVPMSHCTVNFRYTRRLDPLPIIRMVEDSARANGVGLTYWTSGGPLFTPPGAPLVPLAREVAGQRAPITVPYRTDACALSSAFPCIVFGPGSHKQAHTVNEWVSLEQLHQGVELYQRFIRRVCV
jgi:acetylornithine deacetylase